MILRFFRNLSDFVISGTYLSINIAYLDNSKNKMRRIFRVFVVSYSEFLMILNWNTGKYKKTIDSF